MPTKLDSLGSNLKFAPPIKTVDGLKAVPIDIERIEVKLYFDGNIQTGTGDAEMSFRMGSQNGNQKGMGDGACMNIFLSVVCFV